MRNHQLSSGHLEFDEVMNHLNLGIFRHQPGGATAFIFVNDTFCEILNTKRDDLLAKRVQDVFAVPERFEKLIAHALKSKHRESEKIYLLNKAGKDVLCSITLIPIRDDKKKVTCFDGVVEDLSGKLRAEKELRESRELFKMVFNNSAVAITVADKEQKIVAWNPFAETLLGMRKKDLFNKPLSELYPEREWARIKDLDIQKKGVISDVNTQVIRKDGALLDVDISISIIRDTEGNIAGSIGIIKDVSKQKSFERRIKESENKFRVILENSPIGITLTDEEERIITWNPYMEQLLGVSGEEIHMRKVSEIYPSEEWEKIRAADIRDEGARHHMDTKITRQDGEVIDVDLSVNVLKDANNKIIGSVGILQDITKQKRYQRMLLESKIAAEEANNAKSLFLANMSHEVRTPMNTIIGMIDLTLDTELSDEQRENMSSIKNAADILLSLLNDILDLSRVEAGKIQLESIELNIRNIVKSVCKGMDVLAKNKGLELKWSVDDKVPDVLVGDPVRIRQVIVNLINNALKFTFQGAIEVVVKVEKDKKEDCLLRIAVKDQGVGIAQDKLESIFDVFTQADTSTTRRFGGTGLGLTISKRLVEMMGGRIWVESEEFKGSTFIFTVRLLKLKDTKRPAESVPDTELKAAVKAPVPEKGIDHLKILLAEDNLVNQKITQRMLEKRGWEVKTADNGKQVLEHLDEEAFDLILMDAQMPVLDGYESTQRIRAREKEKGGHIPIIALTARAMTGDRQRCLEAGMDDYVSKPIDRKVLFETIENQFKKGQENE